MDAERQALLEAFSDRVERAAVFEFVGAVGETETTLKTLDVCQGEDEYRALFVARNWITNVTQYEPGTSEYYIEYILPRVLPWAAAFLGVGLVFFLSFVIWRLVMLCARSGGCCRPSATPSETLSGCTYRSMQILITIFLVGVIGSSIWGCIVAGPQVLSNIWIGLDELLGFGYFLLGTGDKIVTQGTSLLSRGGLLLDFLTSNLDPAAINKLLTCTQDILDQIPATADQVFQAVQPVIERLAAVPPMGFAAMASMRELTNAFLPNMVSSTSGIVNGVQLTQDILRDTSASLAAYSTLPSTFDQALEPVQAVVDANMAMDIPLKIQQVELVKESLQLYIGTVGSRTLDHVVGNLTFFTSLVGSLANQTLPQAVTALRSASSIPGDAVACVGESLEKVSDINKNLVELPPEASDALAGISSNLELLDVTEALDGQAGEAIKKLQLPPAVFDVLSTASSAREALSNITTEDAMITLDFFVSAGEALSRAEEPVATNTADGQAFIGSNDEAPFAIFSRSRDLAQARLGDLLATIQDESVSNSVIVTFTQAAILNSALEGIDMEELNRLMSTLQAELSGTQLEELTSTINFINSTITNVQKAVVVPLAKGLEMATGFVEQLKSAIAEINGTIEVVSSQVGSVLKDTKSVIQDANSSLQEVEKLLGDVRLISDTANYARVYCTYAIFAITMFAAVMVIVGVWMNIPFLYNWFTILLLIQLVLFFILFIPFGSVVVVGSDSCNLVESKLQATIDSLPYSEQQRAIMHAAADYYFFMEGYSSGLELVSDLSGINLVQLLPEIQSYKDTLVDQISGLPLRPRLRDSVQELGVAVSDVVSSVDDGISSLENRYINSIYVGIKAGVCCSVVGTAGFQWMAMLVTGCLIVGSAVFIYAYVARLDKLPPKSGCLACCGCFRHMPSDKTVESDQFIMASDLKEMDTTSPPGKYQPPGTPEMGRV